MRGNKDERIPLVGMGNLKRTMTGYCGQCQATRTFHFDSSMWGFKSGWHCTSCGGGLPSMASLLAGRQKR